MTYADTQLAVLKTMAIPGACLLQRYALRAKCMKWYTTDGKWVSDTTVNEFKKAGLIAVTTGDKGSVYATLTPLGLARAQAEK